MGDKIMTHYGSRGYKNDFVEEGSFVITIRQLRRFLERFSAKLLYSFFLSADFRR